MFATELAGQVALRRHDYKGAIKVFESLRCPLLGGSRVWLVFSYRLADALSESGDRARGLALLEELRQRTEAPSTGEQIDDVRGRILYRIALCRQDAGRVDDAVALARQATTAFARSGIIAPERRAAVTLLADLLSQSGAAEECRQFLITAREQAEKEGDFETLRETGQRLAAHKSETAIVSNRPTRLADL
jgi:tetratricopeptide (TPR) repeat protein